MLLAREILIMLIVLNQIGDSWGNPEVDLTLLTFPLPEAFFAPHWGNVNNVNHVKYSLLKNASGRGNVNNVNSYLGLLGKSRNGFNIINIINISPVRSIFASHWEIVNNVNNVKSISGFSQEAPSGFNIINIINIYRIRSTFFHYKDLTLLTLLAFTLPEALLPSHWGMLIMLNPMGLYPQEPPFGFSIINIINIFPVGSFFFRE